MEEVDLKRQYLKRKTKKLTSNEIKISAECDTKSIYEKFLKGIDLSSIFSSNSKTVVLKNSKEEVKTDSQSDHSTSSKIKYTLHKTYIETRKFKLINTDSEEPANVEKGIRSSKMSDKKQSKQSKKHLNESKSSSFCFDSSDCETEYNKFYKIHKPKVVPLLKRMKKRIEEVIRPDCIIHIGNTNIKCHLMVLQLFSKYINDLEPCKEIRLVEEKISVDVFQILYDWMVHCEPIIVRTNVLDILNAADYLDIPELKQQCWAFIDNEIIFNENTAYDLFIRSTGKYSSRIKEMMLPRIEHFFLILVSYDDWLELDIDIVIQLLSSNYIKVNNEMEIFASAVRWISFKWEERWKYRKQLFDCVRFGYIVSWQLVDIKRNLENPNYVALAKDPYISKLIDDGLAFSTVFFWSKPNKSSAEEISKTLKIEYKKERHWTGDNITHATHKDFLIYIENNRKKIISRNKKNLRIKEDE